MEQERIITKRKEAKKNEDIYSPNKKEWAQFVLLSYALMFLLGYAFYKNIFFSLAIGFAFLFWIEDFKEYKRKKEKKKILMQFKDMLYSISSSLAAGRQMGDCLEEAYNNLDLIYPESTPLTDELRNIVRSMRENRDSDHRLLVEMSQRIDLEDVRNFVDVYVTCKSRGGNLKEVIDKTSKILLEKLAVEREIKTLMSQKKFEGRIISVMPMIVILGLNLFSSDYLARSYFSYTRRSISLYRLRLLSAYSR